MAINNGDTVLHHRSTTSQTLLNHKVHNNHHNINSTKTNNGIGNYSHDCRNHEEKMTMRKRSSGCGWVFGEASFMKWTAGDVLGVVKHHPIPCVFAALLLFFMGVEYTLRMIPSSSPPFDIGFIATVPLHRLLASRPALNTLLAGLNTVFVGMQTGYILWTWVIEGRPRATIATLFMFTFRGILGYSTQLPLPEGFLGSGVDFPVGNVSFFLFYSGHVAASIIASLDMKRMQRWELAMVFDALNILQIVRLLSTRGHYTIDLAVGVGAGMLFDSQAGKYEEWSKKKAADGMNTTSTTYGAFLTSSKHENGAQY